MVCGFRYNARVLARHIAQRLYGIEPPRAGIAGDDVVTFLVNELTRAPELAMQKGYLARVLTSDGTAGVVDDGILPLEAFVDGDAV